MFGKPKTAAGIRAIELDTETVEWLWRHKRRQNTRRLECGVAWTDDDLVFDRGDGRYLHPNNVSHGFPKLCERVGVPRIRLHDVRHTSITLMLANGEPARLVQQRAGHADIAMTLGRYGHVLPGQDREAADRLAILLSVDVSNQKTGA